MTAQEREDGREAPADAVPGSMLAESIPAGLRPALPQKSVALEEAVSWLSQQWQEASASAPEYGSDGGEIVYGDNSHWEEQVVGQDTYTGFISAARRVNEMIGATQQHLTPEAVQALGVAIESAVAYTRGEHDSAKLLGIAANIKSLLFNPPE